MKGAGNTHLGDGEDCAEGDAEDEHEQERAVHGRKALRVENREQDEPQPAQRRAQNRQQAHNALPPLHIRDQPPAVSQPSLDGQTQREADAGDGAADDEERLEEVGGDVGDVRDLLAGGHGAVVRAAGGKPSDEEGPEGAEPYERGEEGEPDVEPVVAVAVVGRLRAVATVVVGVGGTRGVVHRGGERALGGVGAWAGQHGFRACLCARGNRAFKGGGGRSRMK